MRKWIANYYFTVSYLQNVHINVHCLFSIFLKLFLIANSQNKNCEKEIAQKLHTRASAKTAHQSYCKNYTPQHDGVSKETLENYVRTPVQKLHLAAPEPPDQTRKSHQVDTAYQNQIGNCTPEPSQKLCGGVHLKICYILGNVQN